MTAVYILRCADGSYYTGLCQDGDLDRRVSEHNAAHYPHAYTATRRPVRLVFAEHFLNAVDAVAAERRIKGWSRAKKEAMMAGEWHMLPYFAKRPSVQRKLGLK